ncbi:PE family protein [Rhodococcus sp. ABRD24]|uniref:PE family protein n=1 Tax=Rhodococcus sp. ABRD24 TaxID=2507582 RepID=UPI00103E4278|nr:PE family protein [Rhodococcus sp. ABRD24]QBJ96673.1 PE family protein [Rhodococcus sp. ABRD24]
MSDHVFVVPDVLVAAASELEAVAARLQTSLGLHGPALSVPPSGTEEVSILAAGYFNRLANSLTPAAGQGIQELIEAATVLRAQAAAYQSEDQTLGASLTTGM